VWIEFIWHTNGQASNTCLHGCKILGSVREEFTDEEIYLNRMTDFAPPS